ncbi:unnamed protein product [Prorocentrum cordatum]|uniref:Holocytochrome c-type synthase n=1 Tax=Prorocentrum cordatum TaxID=2364126 RepID=A0ABN9XFR3_9DINO|nr:unnamed protein product [Polarella glacialis]CAK0898402.1 unnamed protein product [Polarella glacialis]
MCPAGQHPTGMLGAMLPEFAAAFSEHGKGTAVRPEPDGFSSAPTRCPTPELLASGDGHDASAHAESPGAAALPRHGAEAALLGGPRRRRGSAAPAPREASLRRLRSEAYWEQIATAARPPARSPWDLGVRQRRTGHDEGGHPRAGGGHAARAADGAAGGGGPAGNPGSWAGAVSRELRRAARGPSAVPAIPPAPPPAPPSAASGAALRSRGRSYHLAGSRYQHEGNGSWKKGVSGPVPRTGASAPGIDM